MRVNAEQFWRQLQDGYCSRGWLRQSLSLAGRGTVCTRLPDDGRAPNNLHTMLQAWCPFRRLDAATPLLVLPTE